MNDRGPVNIKLITENYLLPGGTALLGCGPRFFGERLSADLGLGIWIGEDGGAFPFPLVNFLWHW